jgi:hypothetical protein
MANQTIGSLDWSVEPLILNQKPSPFGLVCAGRLGDINADKRSFGLVGDDGHVCIPIYAREADQTNSLPLNWCPACTAQLEAARTVTLHNLT